MGSGSFVEGLHFELPSLKRMYRDNAVIRQNWELASDRNNLSVQIPSKKLDCVYMCRRTVTISRKL